MLCFAALKMQGNMFCLCSLHPSFLLCRMATTS